MDFKNVDKRYRPIPFWSWNEKLDTEESRRQVALMDEAGIGGYFMHARGGLMTEYMGEEWFDNVRAATEEGTKRGMYSWAYDENGWPSGFGGGRVNGLGVEYQQKHLHVEDSGTERDSLPETVNVINGKRYYYEVNEFYVDVLDPKVVKRFIEEIYGEYDRKMKNSFAGFFTDEPQISRFTGFPWSFTLEKSFSERYGYSLVENIDRLFFTLPDSEKVRLDYWQLVTDLFSEAYFKQIYDWCVEHGYGFTGHLVLEEDLLCQTVSNGACMPHYEYFTIPGMDWLGREIFDCLTPMQLASAAAQLGKKQILSETFALAGHNVSHAELKRIYEWQMVHGINLLCTHLEGYSLRGIRKRDYPPAMYYQQPWWEDMDKFFEAVSRIGMLLAEGEIVVDTLLLHNQTTAWSLYDGGELGSGAGDKIMEYNEALLSDMRTLEEKHILYHLGDETLIRRHGRVEGGRFIIGRMAYSKLIIPKHTVILPYTRELIDKFISEGGCVVSAEEMEENKITERSRLSYTMRRFEDFKLHYFVNSDNEQFTANFSVGKKLLLADSGEVVPFSGSYTFAPYESILVIEDDEEVNTPSKKNLSPLSLLGEWEVKETTYNSLTLDKCDYYFDGKLVEKEGYVLNILPRINELRRPVNLVQIYRFSAEHIPDEIYLATETPEIFEIELNGTRVTKNDCGFFRDKAFRMINIAEYVKIGENELRLTSTVSQSESCYDHIDKSWGFEAMKNCLSYDMEIEPVYIVGFFGLRLRGEKEELSCASYRVTEQPTIVAQPGCVDISRLDECGFSQFAGKISLERSIVLDDTDRFVTLKGRGINSIRISVNGDEVAHVMYPPYEVDVSRYLSVGENRITLTLINNLRNMMGPHHLKEGESYFVTPASFFKESNVFNHPEGATAKNHDVLDQWTDSYSFVHFGLCES